MTAAQLVITVIAAGVIATAVTVLVARSADRRRRWAAHNRRQQIAAKILAETARPIPRVPLVPLGPVDLVRQVQPGDEIVVWAHDHQSPLEADPDGELWKHGIVAEIHQGLVPTAWRSTTVVFVGGRRVHTMPQAKTFLVARHGPAAATETRHSWDVLGDLASEGASS